MNPITHHLRFLIVLEDECVFMQAGECHGESTKPLETKLLRTLDSAPLAAHHLYRPCPSPSRTVSIVLLAPMLLREICLCSIGFLLEFA